jgi:hypothetical protein
MTRLESRQLDKADERQRAIDRASELIRGTALGAPRDPAARAQEAARLLNSLGNPQPKERR